MECPASQRGIPIWTSYLAAVEIAEPVEAVLQLIGATALFLLWIAILWRDHRAVPVARVAIAMNFSI